MYPQKESGVQSASLLQKQLNWGHKVLAHYPPCRPAALASDPSVSPYQGCMVCRDW